LLDARRADLEAFLGDLLQRRAVASRGHPLQGATHPVRLAGGGRGDHREPDGKDAPANRARAAGPDRSRGRPAPAACAGKHFEGRRDTAIVMFLLDTGARRAELVGLRLADLDLDLDVAIVLGKGRRERALPFGRKTAVALDRYLRVRARHRDAGMPWLWLGQRGPLAGGAGDERPLKLLGNG